MNERTAVFPGSFDPFTIGHLSIVERGVALFDRLIVAVGINEHKTTAAETADRIEAIRKAVSRFPNVEVAGYSCLTVDFCHERGAGFILRGVRSIADYEYEMTMADVNRRIGSIETVLLYSLPEHSAISSSMVRELRSFGHPVDKFLP